MHLNHSGYITAIGKAVAIAAQMVGTLMSTTMQIGLATLFLTAHVVSLSAQTNEALKCSL